MGRTATSRGSVTARALIACCGLMPALAANAMPARAAVKTPAATAIAGTPPLLRTITVVPASPTQTGRAIPSPSPRNTAPALASPTPSATARVQQSATPRAGASATAARRARATPTPSPTPNPHPGFGAVPWSTGEYHQWQVTGPNVTGTAWQLLTHSGHEWVDFSALVERSYGVTSTFTSRLSFDANSYRLRRYDGVQDVPASVLRATLSGQRLASTLYASWSGKGCTTGTRPAPPGTMAYGQMADVMRASVLRPGQSGSYLLFDPFGSRPLVRATYAISPSQTLAINRSAMPAAVASQTASASTAGVAAIPVLFREGAQPPLVVWYAVAAPHAVLQWTIPGVLTATLTHYEAGGTRTALPVAVPVIPLKGTEAACR